MMKIAAVIVLVLMQTAFADIFSAAQQGDCGEIAAEIKKSPQSINGQDGFGTTPLMYAAAQGHIECVKLLLEHGAEVNTKDNKGYSALWLAEQNRNDEITALLLNSGAVRGSAPQTTYNNFEEIPSPFKWLIAIMMGLLLSVFFLPILFAWLVMMIFFIVSQNSLIDAFAKTCDAPPVHKAWTWTQLIPIWGIIALIITIIKLEEANKIYKTECTESSYSSIWGWILVASIFLSAGILSIIFWVIYWINVSSAAREIIFVRMQQSKQPQ